MMSSMNRRDFLIGINLVLISTIIEPSVLARSLTATDIARLEFDQAIDMRARIIVIGIGKFGAKAVQPLCSKLPDVECHTVLFDPTGSDIGKMRGLFADVSKCDLLFVVSGFDDLNCLPLFEQLADTAKSAGAVTVGVIPEAGAINLSSSVNQLNSASSFDTIFTVSDKSLSLQPVTHACNKDQQVTLIVHAIHQTIATVSNLITTKSVIGVDFADVKSILKSGIVGRTGVGVVKNHGWGKAATMMALERLNDQRVSSGVAGILVSVQGSNLITMDVYNAVAQVIRIYCPDDCNLIIGLLVADHMGSTLKVSVLAVENSV